MACIPAYMRCKCVFNMAGWMRRVAFIRGVINYLSGLFCMSYIPYIHYMTYIDVALFYLVYVYVTLSI